MALVLHGAAAADAHPVRTLFPPRQGLVGQGFQHISLPPSLSPRLSPFVPLTTTMPRLLLFKFSQLPGAAKGRSSEHPFILKTDRNALPSWCPCEGERLM